MPLLTTTQAAARLGVKPATLYAYVSRGILRRHRGPDGRHSRFDAADVEHLANRGRPRATSRTSTLDIELVTSITEIDDHHIRIRGYDLLELAEFTTFEQVAELLWTGVLGPYTPWPVERNANATATGTFGAGLRALVAGRAEPTDRSASGVAAAGRRLIAAAVDSPQAAGDRRCPRLHLAHGATVRSSIAGRLWASLSPRRPVPELVSTVNAALVLLADHEIAASTLAARVAASTRAAPNEVVLAGLGALAGTLHGAESTRVRRLLDEAAESGAERAVDRWLERAGRVPGFGQVLYPRGDPRATYLLERLRRGAPETMVATDRLVTAARRKGAPPPNVDLALATLTVAARIPPDTGEALFATARMAGWLAHAIEEYGEPPLRFRPRARYVGEPQRPVPSSLRS